MCTKLSIEFFSVIGIPIIKPLHNSFCSKHLPIILRLDDPKLRYYIISSTDSSPEQHFSHSNGKRHFAHSDISPTDLCLVCFKPMAPLYCRDTTFLVKLWYLKGKDSVDQIDLLFLKDISAGEV